MDEEYTKVRRRGHGENQTLAKARHLTFPEFVWDRLEGHGVALLFRSPDLFGIERRHFPAVTPDARRFCRIEDGIEAVHHPFRVAYVYFAEGRISLNGQILSAPDDSVGR
jgi:hypothetical protein